MNIDYLSQLPVDVFIRNLTYLPFDDVINVCSSNRILHNYCINPDYNNKWRQLIDDTFKGIYNYQEKLKQIRNKLNINESVYNYLVYTHLVKVLDPITQLMIYYRQDDMKSFNNPNFTNVQKFLALFLLGQKDKINDYLPNDAYFPFISMLKGHKIDQNIVNEMLIEMANEGSVNGVLMMLSKGADIHTDNDLALRWGSKNGYLEIVRYLTEKGADIHVFDDLALRWGSREGHLDVVKYLTEKGADIHAEEDAALRWASDEGHLEVVKYLTEQGADVHADNDYSLRRASESGHLEVVKYLVEHEADIHAYDDWPLREASKNGCLEVVRYLVEHGADIHAENDQSLKGASANGHLEVVEYLTEHGADIHADNNFALRWARQEGHLDVVEYLESFG